MQNCSKSTENYCFKHKNLVGFRGLCPLDPCRGLRPQTPVIGSRSRAGQLAMCVLLKNSYNRPCHAKRLPTPVLQLGIHSLTISETIIFNVSNGN